MPEHTTPVGIPEIATLAGVQRATVERWLERTGKGLMPVPFPPHRWVVGAHRAWDRDVVVAWLVETGRMSEEET